MHNFVEHSKKLLFKKEKNFDGITNATPDKFHKETSVKILNNGYKYIGYKSK